MFHTPSNPKSRKTAVTLFALVLSLLAVVPASAAPDCRTLHGRFTVQLESGPGCDSPVDLCGSVEWRGSLHASSYFIATGIATTDQTPNTGVILVTGDNVITLEDGQLFSQDAVLLATTPGGEFAEIDTITGGTGAFEGASGKIVATGVSSGSVAEGSFVGEVCWG